MPSSSRNSRAVDAIQLSINRELEKRGIEMKPIEIVKVAISAYLSFVFSEEKEAESSYSAFESADKADLRRGTQAAVDRLLFNANYWRAAYEQRIIDACESEEDAQTCLQAVSVWTKHTLKLNKLSPDEVVSTFERFCPPFEINNRRGSANKNRAGKGPIPDFEQSIEKVSETESPESIECLNLILADMKSEGKLYESFSSSGTLNALFAVLPAWCLQNKIELVNGAWWDDYDVMSAIINAIHSQFLELGFGDAVCQYFLDSCFEALDAYHRDVSEDSTEYPHLSVTDLVSIVQEARSANPNFETDGYGSELPDWLISKEQLIWNILVGAIFGPASARPLLVDSPDLLSTQGYTEKTDVITDLAKTSFARYSADRAASKLGQEFTSFSSLPTDLKDSSIAYISSINSKLETLGYEILPAGSCYPERCVTSLSDSEIECLAILEHRRWLKERELAGWTYSNKKNVEAKESPYMVPWEELPDRAKEWNRSAVRSIPALLASVNLAVVK